MVLKITLRHIDIYICYLQVLLTCVCVLKGTREVDRHHKQKGSEANKRWGRKTCKGWKQVNGDKQKGRTSLTNTREGIER